MPRLLDEHRPNLIWRVLVDVVGRPAGSPAVRRARGDADAQPPVSDLLAALGPGGSGATPWHRYRGAAWLLVAAVELGADPGDPRLGDAGAALLRESTRSGALAPEGEKLPCATARAAAALAALGFGGELRLSEALAWLESLPHSRDGGWPCRRHGAHGRSCPVTAVALLDASVSTEEVSGRGLARRAAESLMEGTAARVSSRLGWPNLLRVDLAEMLSALARAGVAYDRRLRRALLKLQHMQDERGRWHTEVEAPRSLGLREEAAADDWVTLHAVTAIARYGEEAELPRMFPEKPE